MKKTSIILLLPLSLVLASSAAARVNTLSGGVSAGYEYFDRNYTGETTTTGNGSQTTPATSQANDHYSRFLLSPNVTIVSETPRDKAEIDYTPSLYYDVSENDHNIDHNLAASYFRSLSQYWQMNLGDNFVETDQFNDYSTPVTASNANVTNPAPSSVTAESQLREEPGRRRYSTNNFNISTDYTYAEDSLISVGYSWDILRNDASSSTSYQDFDKHDVNASLSYRFNPKWKANGYGRYIRGLYGPLNTTTSQNQSAASQISNDLKEYNGGLGVESDLIRHQPLSLTYDYTATSYDSTLQNDSQIHSLTLGWQWLYSQRLHFEVGAGPTYITQDNADSSLKANGNASVAYQMEKGSLALSAAGGSGFQNFSGTQANGLTTYWQTRADFTYNIKQFLQTKLYALYRDESIDQVDTTAANGQLTGQEQASGTVASDGTLSSTSEDNRRVAAGCSFSYMFREHYSATLSYSYVRENSNVAENEYDDNRIQFTLAYANDFLRW